MWKIVPIIFAQPFFTPVLNVVEHKNRVFCCENRSLPGHWFSFKPPKRNWLKKTGRTTFLTTTYPKTILISWYVHCNTLLIWSNYSAPSPKGARKEWLQFRWDFVKLSEWWNNLVTLFFLSYSSARISFIPFALHTIFFFRQAVAGIFFSKSATPTQKCFNGRPLKHVSALDYDNLWHGLWRISIKRPISINPGLNRPRAYTTRVAPLNGGSTVRNHSHVNHLC